MPRGNKERERMSLPDQLQAGLLGGPSEQHHPPAHWKVSCKNMQALGHLTLVRVKQGRSLERGSILRGRPALEPSYNCPRVLLLQETGKSLGQLVCDYRRGTTRGCCPSGDVGESAAS